VARRGNVDGRSFDEPRIDTKKVEGSGDMNQRTAVDKMAALIPAVLLILTALGNATVMLVVSTLALVVLAVFFRREFLWGGILAGAVGCVVALAISLMMMLRF
jgi:hypothetical protein